MEGTEGSPAVAGLLFLIWLIFVGGIIIGWVVMAVAAWRGMKAHESIAASMKEFLASMHTPESSQPPRNLP